MDLWSSVIRSDFISQVPRITTAGRHWIVTHGWRLGGWWGQTKWKRVVSVCVREKEKVSRWQSGRGNTIKGNECHSVIPTVWSACLCQLSWQPEVWSLSPSHWGKAQFQCQMLALLYDSPGTMAPTRDHHFLDKELQLLHTYRSKDQGSAWCWQWIWWSSTCTDLQCLQTAGRTNRGVFFHLCGLSFQNKKLNKARTHFSQHC